MWQTDSGAAVKPGGVINYAGHLPRYTLVAFPEKEVLNELEVERKFFEERFTTPTAAGSRLFIEIASFHASEYMENTLIRWIQRICDNQPPFTVTLNNFGAFPPQTIYLRVQNHQPFKKLSGSLLAIEPYIRSSNCPPPSFHLKPYLKISGSLTEPEFEEAAREYAGRLFHGSFPVNQLVLLKTEPCETNDRHVTIFPLALRS